MALPTTPASSWIDRQGTPSRLFEGAFDSLDDYELYEEDNEFVLSIDMPGFDPAEITVAWDDGMLNVAAEHVDEERDRRKTYHRRFRFPKAIAEDEVTASYKNGVLEVTLPLEPEATTMGTEIPIET